MTLKECCDFAQDMMRIPITRLGTTAERADFCALHQFHPMQEYLLPHTMELFLERLTFNEIVSVTDLFRVRMLFFRVGSVPLVVGPFCTEFFSLNDCESLLRQIGLKSFSANDLQGQRGKIPVCQESVLHHTIHCLFRAMRLPVPEEVRQVHYTKNDSVFQDVISNISYAELVERRYELEATLMAAVEHGDVLKALESWKELHNSVAFLKHLGQTLETARSAAAITRTAVRFGASNAGLPPILNDEISARSASIIRHSRTIDEIDREHERMIREYCQIIRRKKTAGYSNLTLSVLYELEHSYTHAITIQDIAQELEVSPNHMIAQFKREVGTTPLAYLNRLRMQYAAHSLAHTKASVREIAESVGIMDANYFVKRFKAEFQDTPSEFRSKYAL